MYFLLRGCRPSRETFNHVKLRPGRTQLLILAGETGDCSDSSGTLVSPAKASSQVALDEQNLNKFNDQSVFVIGSPLTCVGNTRPCDKVSRG